MQYHGLLDWRLALDMARVGRDAAARIDLNTPWSAAVGNPWLPLIDGACAPVSRTLAQFGYVPSSSGVPQCYVSNSRRRVLIASHPLWTPDHPVIRQATQEAEKEHPGFDVAPMDLFMVVRRPGDYI